ncbi:DoxX family protein [Algibacillus agarilyticus]|uniref:DoxX family protein n=1 Tax=Algibacillus agarilyticus TaxID=2234133 RepID=UPI000DCFE156|nr:DoxX family protein [Algibacillus agarilyticus]
MTLFKRQDDLLDLGSRFFLAAIFALSGLSKITNYEGSGQYMEAMGIPAMLLPLAIMTEIFGSLLIILGYKTKIVAFLLAGFCIVSAILFHAQLGDQNQFIHFFKNVAMTGGFLALCAKGAGGFSLDSKMKQA